MHDSFKILLITAAVVAAFIAGFVLSHTMNAQSEEQRRRQVRADAAAAAAMAYTVFDSTGIAWLDSVRRASGRTYLKLAPGVYTDPRGMSLEARGLFNE